MFAKAVDNIKDLITFCCALDSPVAEMEDKTLTEAFINSRFDL